MRGVDQAKPGVARERNFLSSFEVVFIYRVLVSRFGMPRPSLALEVWAVGD